MLSLLVVSLRAALRESIRYFASKPEIVSQSSALHHKVYDAVAAHQSEAARQAMRDHFRITLAEVDSGNPLVSTSSPQERAMWRMVSPNSLHHTREKRSLLEL